MTPLFARCKCGYRKTLDLEQKAGEGEPVDFYPALCVYCDEVIALDHGVEPLRCPECGRTEIVSFRDEKLVSQKVRLKAQNWFPPEHEIHQLPKDERQLMLHQALRDRWDDIVSCCAVPPYMHFCPKCRMFRLEFCDEGGRAE